MNNVNTATSLLVAGFLKSCTDKSDTRCAIASDGLPTATLANLYVKITKKTPTTETKAITALAKQTFTLNGGSAADDIATTTGMAIDDDFDTIKKKTGDDFGAGAVAEPKLYKAGDLLLIGKSLADGEVVYVKADATAADTLTIVRGMPLPVSLAAAGRNTWCHSDYSNHGNDRRRRAGRRSAAHGHARHDLQSEQRRSLRLPRDRGGKEDRSQR